jgi:hypothetical protein
MSASYNDGTVQYGARTIAVQTSLTSTAAIGTYVCDNINVSRPTKAVDRTNETGEPTGSVGIPDFVTGTATLQLADTSAKEPANGNVFAVIFDTTISTETFILTNIGRAEVKDAEKKISVSFKKKYGA